MDKQELLENLINDESNIIRAAVASYGYGLETLISDKSNFVCAEAVKQLFPSREQEQTVSNELVM